MDQVVKQHSRGRLWRKHGCFMLTITRLEPQKRNPERLNVYLDGEFAFGISRTVAPWLEEGNQLSQQKISALQNADKIEAAYQRALNFLSYRSRSEHEIQQNLRKHKISEEIIPEVLSRLRENRLVNDRDFSIQWVENRIKFHPRGKRALGTELIKKGISDQIIEEVLQDINEEELALKLARRKMARIKKLDKSEFRKKMYGYLSRRGFDYSLCREVTQLIWNEIEDQI
jgi:regulatory protein